MPQLQAISLNPNIQKDDVSRTGKLLLDAILNRPASHMDTFKKEFLERFVDETYFATTYITGRGGWYALLKALGVGEGDEVLVPAFTCVAVVNPIRWVGATPKFIDNTNDFHVDLNDAKKKLSEKSKVLLVQHTFGQPDDIERCKQFCDDNNLILIEDCAHALGAEVGETKTGLTGKAAFYSFGRDKCLTAGSGGMVITNDKQLQDSLEKYVEKLAKPSKGSIIRHLLYILSTEWIYTFYAIHPVLGKLFHSLFMAVGLNQKANSSAEKRGERDDSVLQAWDECLAGVGLGQLERYDTMIAHRRKAARFYDDQLVALEEQGVLKRPPAFQEGAWLRYSILVKEPDSLRRFAAKRNIVLGDWYDQVIGPIQVDLDAIDYEKGIAPKAEWLSQHVVNLPTAPRFSQTDFESVVSVLELYFKKHNQQKLKARGSQGHESTRT